MESKNAEMPIHGAVLSLSQQVQISSLILFFAITHGIRYIGVQGGKLTAVAPGTDELAGVSLCLRVLLDLSRLILNENESASCSTTQRPSLSERRKLYGLY